MAKIIGIILILAATMHPEIFLIPYTYKKDISNIDVKTIVGFCKLILI